MLLLRFEIEGEDYGEAPIGKVLVHSDYQPQGSLAYFCPKCSRIWARVISPGQEAQAVAIDCEKHPTTSPFRVPGSLWLSYRPEFLAALPRKVLDRELRIHLDHFKRFLYDSRY